MRFQFLMVPAAIVATAPFAHADNIMTAAQAQEALFPGAKFTPADLTLSEAEVNELIKQSHAIVYHSKVKLWKVSTGGWFLIDQVMGRDDIITYAIGLDEHGAVKGIEIMVCNLSYDGVTDQKWLGRFTGKVSATADNLSDEVPVVSGTTLSSVNITNGVKRILTTYALFIAPKAG